MAHGPSLILSCPIKSLVSRPSPPPLNRPLSAYLPYQFLTSNFAIDATSALNTAYRRPAQTTSPGEGAFRDPHYLSRDMAMSSKNWNDRADKDLFFTILSVKNIGVISGSEWATIGNHMRTLGYGFTNEGCR